MTQVAGATDVAIPPCRTRSGAGGETARVRAAVRARYGGPEMIRSRKSPSRYLIPTRSWCGCTRSPSVSVEVTTARRQRQSSSRPRARWVPHWRRG